MAVTINGTTGIVTPDIGVDGSTLVIDSANNRVGVLEDSPSNTLTVGDTVQPSYAPTRAGNYIEIARTSGADAGLLINKNTGQWLVGINNGDGANAPLRFEYAAAGSSHPGLGAGTLGMIIKHNGSVGIGTDSPGDTRLFVDNTFDSTYATNAYNDDFLSIKNSSTIAGTASSIYMLATGNGSAAAVGTINLIHSNDGSGDLSFQTRHNSSMYERLRIQSSGRIGVGTNDPNALLEVRDSENATQGNAQIRISKGFGDGAAPTSVSRANSYLHIGGSEYNTSFGKYTIAFGYTNDEIGSGIPAYIGFVETSLAGYTQGDLVFGTRENTNATGNPAERLRIKSDGDVFIGNIAHANDNGANSSYRTLTLADTTNGAQLHLRGQSPKLYMDVTSGGTAEIYYDSGNFTISSGEPGNAGSTERLSITNTGGVTIGSGNGDASMSQFGSNTGGLLIDDVGVGNTGLQVSHGSNSTYLVQAGNSNSYLSTYSSTGHMIFGVGSSGNERFRITNTGAINIGSGSESSTSANLVEMYVGPTDESYATIRGKYNRTNQYNRSEVRFGVESNAAGKGFLAFATGNNSASERLRITSDGHKWTNNGSIFHGSNDVTDFTDAARDTYNNVSIRAGYAGGDASPTNRTSAIKIYPAGTRSATVGTLTGGIAWQHLDPNNGSWGSIYGEGAQIWMGAAIHDTPGQERDRFNLWMNSGTTGNSQPGNLAIEAYPNGMVRHPKVPAFHVCQSTGNGGFAANSKATWDQNVLNNGSCFDFTNNRFVAPIDGIYHFTCMMLSSNNSRLFHDFYLNGSRVNGTRSESYQGTSYQTNTIVATISMSANDYTEVFVGANGGYGSIYANFNGFLVG